MADTLTARCKLMHLSLGAILGYLGNSVQFMVVGLGRKFTERLTKKPGQEDGYGYSKDSQDNICHR